MLFTLEENADILLQQNYAFSVEEQTNSYNVAIDRAIIERATIHLILRRTRDHGGRLGVCSVDAKRIAFRPRRVDDRHEFGARDR